MVDKRILITLAFLFCSLDAHSQDKTDVVVMTNGDHFVGEIKKLEFGQLSFKASYMADSVKLDWTKVQQLESVRRFRVELANGQLRSGSILKRPSTASSSGDFDVVEDVGTISVSFLEVVSLDPLAKSLWRRFRGSVDVGFTIHPHQQTAYSTNSAIDFPAENFLVSSQVTSQFSRQEGAEDSEHHSASLSYYRFLSKNWFAMGVGQALKNNQLDLDLRTTLGGGGGRFLIHTNRTILTSTIGVGWTREKYFDTDRVETAEGLLGVRFYTFSFASSQFDTRIVVYPGLTEWGRLRVDFQSSIVWELWKNAFWKLSVLENYDSRPPEGSRNNDFTLTNTFGVSF